MTTRENRKQIPSEVEIPIGELIGLLLRKLHWLIISGLVFGIAAYILITLLVTPTYESRISFFVFNTTNSYSQTGTINSGDIQAAESLADTYSKILSSNSVLDAVSEDLSENLSRKKLSGMVDVSVVDNTQLLEVVVTSTDASLAYEIASSFADKAPTEIVRITKAGGVEVVDQPEVASEKSAPRTMYDSAIAFVLGVLAAAAVIIGRHFADTRIYLPEDITDAADITVLGAIPDISLSGDDAGWKLETKEGGALWVEKEK